MARHFGDRLVGFGRGVGPLPAIDALDLRYIVPSGPPEYYDSMTIPAHAQITVKDVHDLPAHVLRAIRNPAEAKAMGLLLSMLNTEQRRTFFAYGWFEAAGFRMGFCDRHMTVHVRNYCISPATPGYLGPMPWPDDLVTMKLWAEGSPSVFRHTANLHPSMGCMLHEEGR